MGDPKDNDIENPDETAVSADGMNEGKGTEIGAGTTEDSLGAGTSTSTSTNNETFQH